MNDGPKDEGGKKCNNDNERDQPCAREAGACTKPPKRICGPYRFKNFGPVLHKDLVSELR